MPHQSFMSITTLLKAVLEMSSPLSTSCIHFGSVVTGSFAVRGSAIIIALQHMVGTTHDALFTAASNADVLLSQACFTPSHTSAQPSPMLITNLKAWPQAKRNCIYVVSSPASNRPTRPKHASGWLISAEDSVTRLTDAVYVMDRGSEQKQKATRIGLDNNDEPEVTSKNQKKSSKETPKKSTKTPDKKSKAAEKSKAAKKGKVTEKSKATEKGKATEKSKATGGVDKKKKWPTIARLRPVSYGMSRPPEIHGMRTDSRVLRVLVTV
ncbi:hypothetical protein C1H76_3332 [Elsinoe australis]|uniref:Uncharacterized protein n=1 Tax=Elsinoe australis TaxID=40998 RepID=A0A4U7B8F7_9PEZI|nr:hypothetical protein C1H76_3332 [Elsinoe australis]